jgi:hypothetical protein
MRLHLREIIKALPAFAENNPEFFEEGTLRGDLEARMPTEVAG